MTEDRKSQGLVLTMSVRDNITLAHLERLREGGGSSTAGRKRAAVGEQIARLRIRTREPSST